MTTYQALLKLIAALKHTTMDPEQKNRFIEFISNKTNLTFNFDDFDTNREMFIENDCCNTCQGTLKNVADIYKNFHGYLSLIVCLFGTVANLFNIVVLTRKELFNFPVNRILAGLAVADMFLMVEYIPFTYYYSIDLSRKEEYTYSLAVYMLFHSNFAQVLHTINMCLTLTLAFWRYITIKYPERSQHLCTNYRCTISICASYILPIFLCIPSYFLSNIKSTTIEENGTNYTLYHVHLSKLASENKSYYLFCLYTFSVVVKWLPCFILTIISYSLIKTLYQAGRRKKVLRGYNACSTETGDRRAGKTERRTERTTRMLVAVLLLFLLTEVPQGILVLMSAYRGAEFFRSCYSVSGNLMDILALINGAINFILYCSMSRQFRTTFGQLFKPKILVKWPAASQTELQSTYV